MQVQYQISFKLYFSFLYNTECWFTKIIHSLFLRVHTYNMTNSHKTVQSGLNLHLHDTQEHHMYKGLINVTFKSMLVTFPVSVPDVLDCEQSLFPLRESCASEQAARVGLLV